MVNSMLRVRILFLSEIIIGILFNLNHANAQSFSLLDESVQIAYHSKKASSTKLEAKQNIHEELKALGAPQSALAKLPESANSLSFDYTSFINALPVGAGTFDGKPKCKGPAVRKTPVTVDSEELKYFDMLYYDFKSKADTLKAESWSLPVVPYIEGDIYNPYREGSIQQSFGRFFDIRCLPTRVHFPLVNGVRFEEYREGDSAWDQD